MENRQIAADVLVEWLEPSFPALLQMGLLSGSAAVAKIDDKIKATGWVDENYSILDDLQPYLDDTVAAILRSMLLDLLADVPDDLLPDLLHSIARSAIEKDELSLLDGKLTFSAEMLGRLKEVMSHHLPEG